MRAQDCFARSKRLRQLHGRDEGGGLLVVALDHSFTDGPPARGRTIDELVDLTFHWFETRTHFRVQSSVYTEKPGR